MDGIADYRFLRELGSGAHGTYYAARPPARLHMTAEVVAVKVIRGITTQEGLRRLTRELRAFAAATSPYLVRPLDAGQDGASFFYATEYCPDGSLQEPAQPLPRVERLRAVGCAARGAHALHEAGVAHRAIKPQNILLTANGAKLSDAGLAHALQPGQTVSSLGPVGAVQFVDPAVLTGQRPSRASDIRSLGATLHYALAGVGLYGALDEKDPLAAVRAVLTRKPQVSQGLMPADASVIRRGLGLGEPGEFVTAEAMAEALDDLIELAVAGDG